MSCAFPGNITHNKYVLLSYSKTDWRHMQFIKSLRDYIKLEHYSLKVLSIMFLFYNRYSTNPT